MNRDTTRLGANDVEYELTFESETLIQRNAYALLSIPNNDIKMFDTSLSCWEASTRRNLECNLEESTETDFIIKIEGLCKYEFCKAGDRISIVLDLANSNSIVFENDSKSIEFEIYTQEGFPV